MTNTPIEWTDFSVNPIRFRNKGTGKVGHFCEKISPGCKHCYSDKMQQGPYLSGLAFLAENADKGESFFDDAVLQKVLKRRKPARIFWCDMTDMFGRWVPDEWIDRCFAVMALTPHLTHQVLTKRADRMREYFASKRGHFSCEFQQNPARSVSRILPLENVWLGVSVEDQQRADERIPLLLQAPAAVRFLSVEPLLGPVDLSAWLQRSLGPCGCCDAPKLDWVIAGGESGPGARPLNVDWVTSIVEQCKAAGVACFVKQLGAHVIQDGGRRIKKDRKGGDMHEWPHDLRVREMPQQGEAHRPDGRGASNT